MSTAEVAPQLSIVIPAYNCASFIGTTVDALCEFFAALQLPVEILVVDDGSRDGTVEAVPRHPVVQVIQQPQNQGKGAAVRRGMLASRGKVCAFTDADLPYGAEPLALAYYYITARGFHAVIGDRTLPGSTYEHAGWLRNVVSELASFLFRALVTGGIYDTQCGMKAVRGDIAREVFSVARINGFAMDVELIYLLLKNRLDIKRMRVRLRNSAPSSVRVVRDTYRAMRDIARLRLNWTRGLYRNPQLADLLEADLGRDWAECFSGKISEH